MAPRLKDEYLSVSCFPLNVYWVTAPYINPVAGEDPITGMTKKKLFLSGFVLMVNMESFFLKSSGKDLTGHFGIESFSGCENIGIETIKKVRNSLQCKPVNPEMFLVFMYDLVISVYHLSNWVINQELNGYQVIF